MNDTTDKAKLRFEVRSQKDPKDETRTIFVPAIVERAEAMQLSKVVRNAINEGRIAGLKPNAAKSIAEGICDQIYEELKEGNSIAFMKYFHVRLYLDGTVADAGSQLTDANRVNVRIAPGSDFRLGLDTFSWSNVANDRSAKLDYIVSASGVRGEIRKGGAIYIDGSGFGESAEGVTVVFLFEDGAVVEGIATSVGPNRIAVAFPEGLSGVADGTEVAVSVTKSVDGGEYTSNTKTATIVAAA
ncbi:MAG: hypothetical protein II823_07745 [Kiritimatiellae bacterium]|nr:hypothetical protein [Kiritimatiellia bacterium]